MHLTIDPTTDIHDRSIARAWVGRDESVAWQCVLIEWSTAMQAVASSPYAGFCAPHSTLTPAQANAVFEVLRFKLEAGESIAGVTLEV